MAIRERKGSFQVYWNNPHTGKRESKTCATRQEAEKEDSLIKHRLKFERESFDKGGTEREKSIVTLETIYMAYLKEKQFSRRNLTSHLSAMRPILRLMGQTEIAEIDYQSLVKVKDAISAGCRASATAGKRLSNLRAVMRWGAEKGFLEMPRFPTLPAPHYEKFIPPTPDELAAMLIVAPSHLQRVIILGSQCGVRVGPCELFSLTWEDVDMGQGILRIHGARKNPNAPWREVPIRESLMGIFRDWQAEDMAEGVKWLVHFGGKPITQIAGAWRTMLRKAGITRRVRPYDLRHAFATELIAAGVDIGTIAKLMGHSDASMILKHYQYVMDAQKRRAVEALPDLGHVPSSMCQENSNRGEIQ